MNETQGERMVRLEESVGAVREVVNNIRGEVSNLADKIENLVGLQHSHDANREAIAGVRDSVREMASRMESWFSEVETDQKERWREYHADRDRWRAEHERDNNETEKKLIWFSGVGFAVMLLGGILVSGFVWVLNDRFATSKEVDAHQTEEITRNRDNIQKQNEELQQIQIYIATQRGAAAAVAAQQQGSTQ